MIAYVGPEGAGLGFQLAGIAVHECGNGESAMQTLKTLKQAGEATIIFVDEGLAEEYLEVVAKLNEDALPAIILLPNPTEAKNLSAQNLQQLMVRAVGSDIFSS